jgi:transposase
VDLKDELFAYQINEDALALAQFIDGKLLLVANVSDLTPQQILDCCKSLADTERGFRVLKSEIEIDRCFIACQSASRPTPVYVSLP